MAMGSSLMISALPNQKTYRPFLPRRASPIPFTEQTIPDQLRCNLEKAPYLFTASIETGGTRDTLRDGDEIRDELYSLAYGFWDFTKNQPGHGAELWNLEWLGSLPGGGRASAIWGTMSSPKTTSRPAGRFTTRSVTAAGPWTTTFPRATATPTGRPSCTPLPLPTAFPTAASTPRMWRTSSLQGATSLSPTWP